MSELLLEKLEATHSILPHPYVVYRATGGENRWYYRPDNDTFYPSVTSVIQSTTPTSRGLLQWMKKLGPDADQVRDERAAYGTFLHIQAEELFITGEYDLGNIALRASLTERSGGDLTQWTRDCEQDLLAFEQFRRDHDVEVIAVESVLTSDQGYAGAIDLVCMMNVSAKGYDGTVYKSGPRKGEPKIVTVTNRERCIVDFKSGRKGFWDSHEIQLAMYRRMWNENYPEHPVENIFNLAPKDWRSAPAYSLKDQTLTRHALKVPLLLELFALDHGGEPTPRMTISGKIKPGVPLSDLYERTGLREAFQEAYDAA